MYPPCAEPEARNSAVGWHWKQTDKQTNFFEDPVQNRYCYLRTISSHAQYLPGTLIEKNRTSRDNMVQQDGATAHTANISMNSLRQQFPGRLISRFGDIHWPSRSPDLPVLDFFLWGYLKKSFPLVRRQLRSYKLPSMMKLEQFRVTCWSMWWIVSYLDCSLVKWMKEGIYQM